LLVPAVVGVLLQPDLLRLAVDAHVQQQHALRKGEVELEPGGVRRCGRCARRVADDVPRLGDVDVSFDDAARRQLGDVRCSGGGGVNDGRIGLGEVVVRSS